MRLDHKSVATFYLESFGSKVNLGDHKSH